MTVEPPGPVQNGRADLESDDDSGLASVVLIDRREDIAGICGRVDTAPTFAVVVHAPNGNRQLSTELGMRRLQRHVEDSGKVVAIATSNSALSARARQVGIPVARKPEHVRWDAGGRRVLRLGRKSVRLPHLGRYVQVAALLVVALVLLGLAATAGPSATLTVYPQTETLSKTITITASPDATDIDFATLKVPSKKVSASQRITLATKTTGTVSVGTVAAKAGLRITNPTNAPMDVPEDAVVLGGPDAVPFQLDGAATVPPGQSVNVNATSTELGGAGNLPANAISRWADARYNVLAVSNPAASAGGLNENRPGVDAKDLTAMKQLAADVQNSQSVKNLLTAARPHDAVFLGTAQTELEYPDPPVAAGTPADVMLTNVDLTVTAYAVLEDTLNQIAQRVLADGQGVGEFIPGTVSATETGARQLDQTAGTIKTELELRGQFVRDLSVDKLKAAVKGKSPDDAKSTLKAMYGIQDADVNVSPGWAPWLPRFSFRINVDLRKKPAEDASAKAAPNATQSPGPAATPTARP